MAMVAPLSDASRFAAANASDCDSWVGSRNSMLMSYLAIDAGADRQRHGVALGTIPRRNDRAEAARRTAGSDHQQVIGLAQRGVFALPVLADHAAFAAFGPLAALDARVAKDVLAHLGFGPARGVEVRAQLRRQDHGVVAWPDRVVAHDRLDLGDAGVEDFLGARGPLVHELPRGARRHHRDRRSVRGRAALVGERPPRRVLLVLGDAVADLARVPECRAIDVARPRVEQVAQDEADRAPDRGGGAVARAERVEATAHAELLAHRSVHHDQDRAAAGAGGRAVE